MYGDRAEALGARRLHVVDAVGAGNHTLERRRNKSANQIGVRANVDRRDLDFCDVAAGILANAERTNRLQARDQDHQIDNDRKDWPLYEEICNLH